MKKARRRYPALLLSILLVLGVLIYPVRVLELCDVEKTEKLLLPLWGSDSFSYEFLHSVQKTPVRENFIIQEDNRLLLVSTWYYSLGVGLPFLPEEGSFINDNGVFKLTGIDREFEYINFGLMPLAQQQIHCGKQSYSFDHYFSSGAIIRLEASTYTPWQLLVNSL
ncbi:MAG: DUF1850 domain-containing protein [Syntrophomonadaceae bacterium]|nr:DUF1850 domain-containing protein [Syntrophomonadaceae bacterium]